MDSIKIFIGESKLNVYNARLIKGEFLILILFGIKDSSTFYHSKLKSIESDISIFWSDCLILLDPQNIEVYLENYSIILTFKVGDIKWIL